MSGLSRHRSLSVAGDIHLTHEARSHAIAVPWFDGWRIVTGILTVIFMVPGVAMFVGAELERSEYEERVARGTADECTGFFGPTECEPPDYDWYYIPGLYLLTASGSFAVATAARRGTALRRISASIGIVLSVIPALIVTVLVQAVVHSMRSG